METTRLSDTCYRVATEITRFPHKHRRSRWTISCLVELGTTVFTADKTARTRWTADLAMTPWQAMRVLGPGTQTTLRASMSILVPASHTVQRSAPITLPCRTFKPDLVMILLSATATTS